MQLQKISEAINLFFQSVFSIIKVILLSKFFVRLPKVKDEECVILGNGPCLKTDLQNDIAFINERKIFCVNLLAFSDEYTKLKPDYYILAAPEFWMKNPIELHEIQRTKLSKAITEKTNWDLKLIIPHKARNSQFITTVKSNPKIDIVYFNDTPVEGFSFLCNILYKNNLGIPRPHNVLIPSIMLALNLGFKKIFLFGADHSWHEEIRVDVNNVVTLNHQHFFDSKETRFGMYKLDGQQYHLHDIFRKLHFAFKGYFVLKNYADYLDSKIINASSKSYIDAFDKISITN